MGNILPFLEQVRTPVSDDAACAIERNRRTLLAVRDALLDLASALLSLKGHLGQLQQGINARPRALERSMPPEAAGGKP
jgi:hypothetical protein